jgi:hypothetical protein
VREETKAKLVLNEDAIAEEANRDGFFGIVTNIPGMEATEIVTHYKTLWEVEQVFRAIKTKGSRIEALRQQEEQLKKLVTAILIAAIAAMQVLAERDGAAARPLADALAPEDVLVLEKVCESVEGKPQKQKSRTQKATSLTPPGFSQGSAAGTAIAANPAPSSW